MRGKVFIISASSGAGKTSLVNAVIQSLSSKYLLERVITYTTRPARKDDIHGQDYFFVSSVEFENLIAQGFFLEWSTFYGHYYGSPRTFIKTVEQGTSFILIIDQVGARQLKKMIHDSITIWIDTKDKDILHRRLAARDTESDEQIKYRLACADIEQQASDLITLYRYRILNDNFEQAAEQLRFIFLQELKGYEIQKSYYTSVLEKAD